MISTLKPFFIYPSPWRGISVQCLYTMPTFPPAGITTRPRNAQTLIRFSSVRRVRACRRNSTSESCELRLLWQDSHTSCPWQWAETWRGCYPHYPHVSGGTRFASIYSISLVKYGQLSRKNSMTTAIPMQQCQNGHHIFLHHQKKSNLRTQESSPRRLYLSSQYHLLIQNPFSCWYQALVQCIPCETPLRKQSPPLSLNEVWVTPQRAHYSNLTVFCAFCKDTWTRWKIHRQKEYDLASEGFSVLFRAEAVFIYVLCIQRT